MSQDIQQRIAQGSEDHVDKYGSGYNGINVGKVRKVDFTAGAIFVLDTILPEFAEWSHENYEYLIAGAGDIRWRKKGIERKRGDDGKPYTTPQLIELFKNRDNG